MAVLAMAAARQPQSIADRLPLLVKARCPLAICALELFIYSINHCLSKEPSQQHVLTTQGPCIKYCPCIPKGLMNMKQMEAT